MCGTEDYKTRLKKYHVQCCQIIFIFLGPLHHFNWDPVHAMLNSHYEALSCKKNLKKVEAYRISVQKEPTAETFLLILNLMPRRLQIKGKHSIGREFQILGGIFGNIDNVRAHIQFRREIQPQHLNKIFSQNRTIHFHINRTSVFRLVKQNQLSFSSIKINKPLPIPVQCLIGQIQVQKPILVAATDQMPDHIQSREQYQHRQQYHR